MFVCYEKITPDLTHEINAYCLKDAACIYCARSIKTDSQWQYERHDIVVASDDGHLLEFTWFPTPTRKGE